MRRTILPFLSWFVMSFLLFSCVDDDLKDCGRPVRLSIAYAYPPSAACGGIDRIDLFVFDSKGIFVGEWSDYPVDLSSDYSMTLPLPAGEYNFVCYGGLEIPPYQLTPLLSSCVSGKTTIESMRVGVLCQSDGSVRNTLSPLFYGRLSEIEVDTSTETLQLLLTENTNRIHVTAGGAINRNASYVLRLEDANGEYYLNNQFASDRKFFYSCSLDRCEKGVEGVLTTLRLSRDRRLPILRVLDGNSGEDLYRADLIDLILQLESASGPIDFERTHDFYLELFFDKDKGVGVVLNGWRLSEQESGVGR